MSLDEYIQSIARDAGRIQKDAFHKHNVWHTKSGRGDIVTEVDTACEKLIIERIKQQYPDNPILSEEAGAISGEEDKPLWIIDPLDGTRNYMMKIPFFCVSIAVVVHGIPEVGAIYDPIHDEMFFARRGHGAFLNGEPIKVANEDSLEDSIISLAWVRGKADRNHFMHYIEKLSKDTSYFRRFGSAALVSAYVACGRIHAYIEGGLCPWDIAAAKLIIEEAGGCVTDFSGHQIDLRNKNIEVIATNPKLHSILLPIASKVR